MAVIMPPSLNAPGALSVDILLVVFDNLVGENEVLSRCGLVSHLWRDISLPYLLRDVDLSSHNNGRLPEHESEIFPLQFGIVMSDYSDEYRPCNLVPRQRALLKLMLDRPELAVHVEALTWTLVWKDFDDEELTDIDLKTWEVFGRMENVARLDLASIHSIGKHPYIRRNPIKVFPATTHLRLVGWMHRGLVKAIVSSLNARNLCFLELDHLQDEGALPDGQPMPEELASEHCLERRGPCDDPEVTDELWERQECGDAGIYPGPMSFPLRLLRQSSLSAMTNLRVRLGPMTSGVNQREAMTMFRQIAEFIRSAKSSLRHILIELGECPAVFARDEDLRNVCGTARNQIRHTQRPFSFDLASAFLHRLLPVLNCEEFPCLVEVDLKGFRAIKDGRSRMRYHPNPELVRKYIRACPFIDERFVDVANLDYRRPFQGYDDCISKIEPDKFDRLVAVLTRS